MKAIGLFQDSPMSGSKAAEWSWFTRCANDSVPNAAAQAMGSVLAQMLDEIDHAVLLLTAGGALRHANRLALHLLEGDAPLRLTGGMISASGEGSTLLGRALADSARGIRRLLTLDGLPVAVVPLAGRTGGSAVGKPPLAMLLLGRRRSDAEIAMSLYASACRLTPAEAEVLRSLCMGASPKEFAQQAGVAISTVRTQIGSIRDKTGAANLRDLISRVAALPPITAALHHAAEGPRRQHAAERSAA